MMQTADDVSVRPTSWDEFVGQDNLKARLDVHIKAAIAGKRSLEHILLAGPPGSGKSTMANLIADSLTDPFTSVQLPGMDRKQILEQLTPPKFRGGVLFLDEIHCLSKRDQELFLSLLSDGTFHDGNGYEWRYNVLTVIGATTERDKLIGPLHDRFTIRPEFEPYTDDQMAQIVLGMARRAKVGMNEYTASVLAPACGGTPRNAKQFVFAARAMAATGQVTDAPSILEFCNVDPDGLEEIHRRYLTLLFAQPGGKAGQKTLETLLRIPGAYCKEVERLLVERGLIGYTPSGRLLTPAGRERALRALGGEPAKLYERV